MKTFSKFIFFLKLLPKSKTNVFAILKRHLQSPDNTFVVNESSDIFIFTKKLH